MTPTQSYLLLSHVQATSYTGQRRKSAWWPYAVVMVLAVVALVVFR